MTIKRWERSDNTEHVTLTACPWCGTKFGKRAGRSRANHIMECEAADEAREIQP